MSFLVKFLFAVLFTELLTELFVKSELFKPVRRRLPSYTIPFHNWFEELINCGYCFSVWAAAGVVILLQLAYNFTGWFVVDLLVTALLVHRSSNILHNCIDKFTDKYYDIRYINTDKEPE